MKLCSQCLVVADDQCRLLYLLDDIGHGKGFAAAGHALQRLHPVAGLDALYQGVNGLRLVAGGLKRRYQMKTILTHSALLLLDDTVYCTTKS